MSRACLSKFNPSVRKKFLHAFSIQFFVLFLILLVPVALAQIEVTRIDDPVPDGCNSRTDCSLREAIIAANDVASGIATIQFEGRVTYNLSIDNLNPQKEEEFLDPTKGSLKILNTVAMVRIEATGSGMATIDANDVDRVFVIYQDTDVEIDDIVITGGKPADENDDFKDGIDDSSGIFVFNNKSLEITNSSITGNSAGFWAGGIWACRLQYLRDQTT